MFDNCAVGKNGAVSAQLPQALVDRGIVSVAEPLYFPTYHGKFRADGRFGGYEKQLTKNNIFGLDDIGQQIESWSRRTSAASSTRSR